jgi:hypothetical protein
MLTNELWTNLTLVIRDGKAFDSTQCRCDFSKQFMPRPGDMVKGLLQTGGGEGLIISVETYSKFVTVLWSKCPIRPQVQVTSTQIQAQTRKLKVRWSPELAQDIKAHHEIDA